MEKENFKLKSFDLIGNIAILKFPREIKKTEKIKIAQSLLKQQKNIKTVLEKIGKFKGKLRKLKTKHLAGEKTKEVLYKENGCLFRLNVDETYFSPRLSNERIEVAKMIKKNDSVLVMFAGISPYSIVIAKNSKAKKIVSIELNRKATEYALQNVKLNKMQDKIEVIQGDVKKIIPKLKKKQKNFSVIVMPRPKLKDAFLKEAFSVSKKGTNIFYYDFAKETEKQDILKKIEKEAKKSKIKIKILNFRKAGEIGPYTFRYRVDFIVV